MKKIILLITTLLLSFTLFGCDFDNNVPEEGTIEGITLNLEELEDYYEINGFDYEDVTIEIFYLDEINVSVPLQTGHLSEEDILKLSTLGIHNVTVELEGFSVIFTVFIVDPSMEPANYLSGIDMRDLSSESKAMILAAAERYLLHTVTGGVPLYTSADHYMYSERTILFSEEYNGVMGFGNPFSQFNADDSTVLMSDGTYGTADEYTWRSAYNTDPYSLNPWTADDSVSEDFINLYTGSLYSFYFDESKTGYEINGELATGDPVALNPEMINGKEFATTWQITVEDNLTWTYHPSIDTSSFNAGYEVLDANDFVWTWKNALDYNWFRAVSGGGDFISRGIKNAEDYIEGFVSWDEVGIKLIDDNTIEVEFINQKSLYEVKYAMADSWQPLNEDLFTSLDMNGYGINPETIASSGIYTFDVWVPGQKLAFTKNDNYVHADMYHFTGLDYSFYEDNNEALDAFLEGTLDVSSVPSTSVEEYLTDLRMFAATRQTTYKLAINGFGTEEHRDDYIDKYPEFGINEDFTPEPILMYLEMKQALQYGIDRNELAVETGKIYLPAYTHFTSTYFVDSEGGLSIRGTDAGASIVDDFGNGTDGYDPNKAVDYFMQAVSMAISDGFYTAGTADNYTTIELIFSSGFPYNSNMITNLEEQYENLLVDNENFVNIDIVLAEPTFTGYDNSILTANFDIGIAGISGSLMCPLSFLDTFRDDNPTGFTFNFGIDTHSVNVPVSYENVEGEIVHELWSFNALAEAFKGKVYIMNGVVQTVFSTPENVVIAKVDLRNEQLLSIEDGTTVAEVLIGKALSDYALELEVDAVHAKIAKTSLFESTLYIITEKNGEYEYLEEFELFLTAEHAIKFHSNAPNYFVDATGPLDDQGVLDNTYLSTLNNEFTTVAEYATDNFAPVEYAELWATNWDDLSDVYIVIHINEYYIGWYWL